MKGGRGHWVLLVGRGELVVAEVASGVLREVSTASLSPTGPETSNWAKALVEALEKLPFRPAWGDSIDLIAAGLPTLSKVLKEPAVSAGEEVSAIRRAAAEAVPQDLDTVVWDTALLHANDDTRTHLFAATYGDGLATLGTALRESDWTPTRVLPLSAVLARLAQDQRRPTLLLYLGAEELHLVGVRNDGSWQARVAKLGFGAGDPDTESYVRRVTPEVVRTQAVFRQAGLMTDMLLLTVEAGAPADLVKALTTAWPDAEWLSTGRGALPPGVADILVATPRALPLDWTPAVLKQARAQQKHALLVVTGALFALLGGLVFSSLTAHKVWAWERADAELRQQLEPLAALESDLRQTLDTLATTDAQLARLQDLTHRRENWHHFLADLQARLVAVEDVWLDTMTMDRRTVAADTAAAPIPVHELRLRGRLLDRENPLDRASPAMRQRIHTLLRSLGDSPFVQAVSKPRFDPSQPGMLGFECTLTLNPERL